jgi:hypothetical protein
MRPRNQHHTGADGNKPEHGAELQTDSDCTHDAREKRGAKWLYEQISAPGRQPATDTSANSGAERNQNQTGQVECAKNYAKGGRTCSRQQGEAHQ